MRLKSLEIQGFKTFPDKTKLSFEQGITSVVGPNGSGKSNISDAIRWVLGEQSPKSLRCSKMEDVVFNGTDKRKKLGYAEVSLNIENKDRVLAYDGDEISITRRYYRSGESEYLINKAQVRLKDINELLFNLIKSIIPFLPAFIGMMIISRILLASYLGLQASLRLKTLLDESLPIVTP